MRCATDGCHCKGKESAEKTGQGLANYVQISGEGVESDNLLAAQAATTVTDSLAFIRKMTAGDRQAKEGPQHNLRSQQKQRPRTHPVTAQTRVQHEERRKTKNAARSMQKRKSEHTHSV